MKLGLDIHGVIDTHTDLFGPLSKIWVDNGNEVHIITGNMRTPAIEELLEYYDVHYTHFFSVSDYLIENGYDHKFEDTDNPWFEKDVWDCQKGAYAARVGIDVHYDDSDEYGKHFPDSTIYMKVQIHGEIYFPDLDLKGFRIAPKPDMDTKG